MLQKGVMAIFGPTKGTSLTYIQSVCDTKEVPHLETKWNLYLGPGSSHLNIYPNPTVLEKAYEDLVQAWKWKSFAILYENNEGLLRIGGLLKKYDLKGHTVTVHQLIKHDESGYRHVLNQVKTSKETYFILDCSIENLNEILTQIQQVGLMSHYHNFIITNLDLHTIDLRPFQWGGSNITGVRLISVTNERAIDVTNSFLTHYTGSYSSAVNITVILKNIVNAIKN